MAHLSADELVRRVRALLAMPPQKRPISLYYLEMLAGLSGGAAREIAKTGRMREESRIRLERAFTWIENNQVTIKKRPGGPMGSRPAEVTIGPPKPPQVTVSVVRFTATGPKIRSVAFNPLAFETPRTRRT